MPARSLIPESRPLAPNNMTLDRARQLLKVQADFGGFHNANSTKLVLSVVQKEHGQAADGVAVFCVFSNFRKRKGKSDE